VCQPGVAADEPDLAAEHLVAGAGLVDVVSCVLLRDQHEHVEHGPAGEFVAAND
jgi:hypothetical protein